MYKHKMILTDNMTVLLSLLSGLFFRFCVSFITVYGYLWYPFFFITLSRFSCFFLYQCIHCINIIFRHEQISCRIGDWILLQRDPLIGGILFGNNNKIDEFFILFYESIFLFLESFSCKKLKLISLFFSIAKSLLVWKSLWKSETWVLMHLHCWDFQNTIFILWKFHNSSFYTVSFGYSGSLKVACLWS